MTLTDRDELIAAYKLLGEAIPLALKALTAGGIEPFPQWCFWTTFESLDEIAANRNSDETLLDVTRDSGIRCPFTDRAAELEGEAE